MNLLLIVFLAFTAYCVYNGYKRGMVKALVSFIGMIVLGIVIVLGIGLFNSYVTHDFFRIILLLIVLIILVLAHLFIKMVLFPAKLLTHLPVAHGVNKVMGVVFGILEALVILWLIYAVIVLLGVDAAWGQWIISSTKENVVLNWLYERNYLLEWFVNR
ncbi:MAG: CvpA family protein [Acetatifactor sp.]|nr:CvpA family protein [Acetatifactor sp.]